MHTHAHTASVRRTSRSSVFIILVFLLVSVSFVLKAQTSAPTPTVITTSNNVVISYTEGFCQGDSVLHLIIENNNATGKSVTYSFFGGTAKTVSVPANTTKQGGCNRNGLSLNVPIPTGQTTANLSAVITVY